MEKIDKNPDTIPTKELMKMRRKADYERAKQERKAQKLAEKAAKKQKKAEAQAEKDALLWESLAPASKIPPTKDAAKRSES